MADKTYALDFTLHDPKTGTDTVKSVTFTSPQGPQGVQGPTGPIGNSYGVYEKTFDTVADYKAFADTAFANGQAIVGGSVLDSGNYVTISILKYDGAQIWYAMPTNVDDDGTPAAWTVEVTPDANEGNLSNFKFYIFDPNYNEDISSYEDEMPPSLQTKVPYYASYAELPTDRETAFSDFGLADGLASNGRMVALFAFVGDELLLVEAEQSDPLVWANLSEAKAIKQGQHVIVEYGAVPTPPADVFFIKDATSGESKDADVVYDYLGIYNGEVTLPKLGSDVKSWFSRKFVFASGTLEQVLISAYENEDFVNAVGFAETTDVGSDGKPVYGEVIILTEELTKDSGGQTIGAEYSVVANGELYHAVLLENGGNYTVAISNPYVKKDDVVLAKALESISGVQQGIVGQYLKQTPAVLVGSDYAINLKLRESRNLFKATDIPETTTGGVTYSFIDGVLKVSGENASGSNIKSVYIDLPEPLEEDGDYIISATLKNKAIAEEEAGNYILLSFYTSTGAYVLNTFTGTIQAGRKNWPFHTPSNGKIASKLCFVFVTGSAFDQEISDIQIEKGSTAHPYDEYGTYSKGSVVQYAGKNVLNLPGTSEMGDIISFAGKADVSSEIQVYSVISFTESGGFQNLNNTNVKETTAPAVKGHNLLVVLRAGEPWLNNILPEHTSSIYDWYFTLLTGYVSPVSASGNYSGNDAYFVVKQAVDVPAGENTRFYVNFKADFSKVFTMEKAIVIDLTAVGDGNLTAQEAYEKYSPYLDTLASGASIANSKRTSPLIKNFGTDLYLTKPEGYSLIISEFSDMPPALNQSVDFDGLTFLAQTKYSSSGKVTLQPTTQSIIYMVEKDGGTAISDGDLALWQSSSQLEYGDYATDVTAYIAPKVLGTFDYLEGETKSIITKVGEGDNVHVGFIPDEGYLGIDYANSTDDLSQSYVAYRTIDLATQVANNVEQIASLETRVSELESIVEGLLNSQQ